MTTGQTLSTQVLEKRRVQKMRVLVCLGLIALAAGPSHAFLAGAPSFAPALARRSAISSRMSPKLRVGQQGHRSPPSLLGLRASSEGAEKEEEVKVAMVGATGGVGRLTAAVIDSYGIKIKAVVRSPEKAKEVLASNIEVVQANLKDPMSLVKALADVDAVMITTGTTAFPTDRWKGGNTPKAVDEDGVKNIVTAIETVNKVAGENGRRIKKVTLFSSIGVNRVNQFPFSVLNAFGVLNAKKAGELAVIDGATRAGYSYSIVRPGRLVGGPFTNPDFAKLLQVDEGTKKRVDIKRGDPNGFRGDCSRISAATALAQTLLQPVGDVEFCIQSSEGPAYTQEDWDAAFMSLGRPAESLRLEFSSLNVNKFKRWLTTWGNGIITSGYLFPPLPIPIRVDYPEDPNEVGLMLVFLSVTVNGEITELGKLRVKLEEGLKEPHALVVRREPDSDDAFPGEQQILDQLQDDLYRVTQNSQNPGEKAGTWGA